MGGLTKTISFEPISGLLSRLVSDEPLAHEEMVAVLTVEFQARGLGKRYFPVSVLRETWRQRLKNLQLEPSRRLRFYRAFSDAAVAAMASSPLPETARLGRLLAKTLGELAERAPSREVHLRLRHIAGMNWEEIGELCGESREIDIPRGDSARGVCDQALSSELQAGGLAEADLLAQNLCPRGEVTQLLEHVRDGRRPLGDVIANQIGKLQRQAEHLLKSERGNISMQSADLVNEMFLRMPRDSGKAPVNHKELEALSRRIMQHILIDRARKPIPSQARFATELSDDLHTPPERLENRLLLKETLEVVESVLKELRHTDPEAAEMLAAILFRGADQKELAKLHGVSVSTVKRRIKDARERVRERLGLE
jgi:RNA polymerase sigma factor (sigma-70 family)